MSISSPFLFFSKLLFDLFFPPMSCKYLQAILPLFLAWKISRSLLCNHQTLPMSTDNNVQPRKDCEGSGLFHQTSAAAWVLSHRCCECFLHNIYTIAIKKTFPKGITCNWLGNVKIRDDLKMYFQRAGSVNLELSVYPECSINFICGIQ